MTKHYSEEQKLKDIKRIKESDDIYSIYAVIFGEVARATGTIPLVRVNKVLRELGYEPMKRADISYVVGMIKGDEALNRIYEQTWASELTISIVPNASGKVGAVSPKEMYDIVSPTFIDNYSARTSINEFRRWQKRGAQQILMSNGVQEAILEVFSDYKLPEVPKAKTELGKNTLVVTPSDWHVGALIRGVEGNSYNFDVFNERMQEYISEVHTTALDPSADIGEIVLVHLGDFIEGVDMRNVNQSFDAEFSATKQIALALRAYVEMVHTLSYLGIPMIVGAIGGNHDRYTANKKEAIYNDNIAYNIVDTLILLSDTGMFGEHVTVVDNREDVYSLTINSRNKNILFRHGDFEAKNGVKITKHIKTEVIDYLFLGHYHSITINQEDYARFAITVGSIMGHNTYSKQLSLPSTEASQMMTVLTAKSMIPIPVFFDM